MQVSSTVLGYYERLKSYLCYCRVVGQVNLVSFGESVSSPLNSAPSEEPGFVPVWHIIVIRCGARILFV